MVNLPLLYTVVAVVMVLHLLYTAGAKVVILIFTSALYLWVQWSWSYICYTPVGAVQSYDISLCFTLVGHQWLQCIGAWAASAYRE
jgi:hypothetical protein